VHVAAIVPQLVPAALPVRVRHISLRRALTPTEGIEDTLWLPQ
jgi:hypothetical protein